MLIRVAMRGKALGASQEVLAAVPHTVDILSAVPPLPCPQVGRF